MTKNIIIAILVVCTVLSYVYSQFQKAEAVKQHELTVKQLEQMQEYKAEAETTETNS